MIVGSAPRKLYISVGGFFMDISGLMQSFGLALFVVLESVVMLQWIAAGPSGKSMREKLGGTKISLHDEMLMNCLTT